ncbi:MULTISPECIES: GAF domain-containing sensor histidine kinase [unclassified Bradyrhizobium]|uniref:GAF domain-containing sensor histidine kinase n=1 Tax=unclassified Bradyrhizobium TaxID=2631580 RepID=UPI002741EB8A|nr:MULTISPECIES: GAF domain-containing sensor histidine kinase [unclassified Bradyrhizobium]
MDAGQSPISFDFEYTCANKAYDRAGWCERSSMEHDFKADIDAIEAIAAVPTILAVVSQVTGLGFSAIARVTGDRWICLAANDQVGLGLGAGGELKVETTICHEVHQAREAVVIDHVARDERYANHHTPAMYGFQSYISMPIFLADGSFFGTLCALDPKPAKLKDPGITGMFRLFADLIGIHLDAARRLATAEAKLLDAKAAAELQEQFMAVLGHDLRNPLAAIAAGTRLLASTPLDERAISLVAMMATSTVRMSSLIEDVIDLARSRLGGKISLAPSMEPLEPLLRQVVDEMRATHPQRRIEAEFAVTKPVFADRQRIARLLSNLLGNALSYSPAESLVFVRAQTYGSFSLSVTNHGPAIPPATLGKLFVPFVRGQDTGNQQGLGLGLFIVSQIASAHGGTIDVTSTDDVTRFTFQMPLVVLDERARLAAGPVIS